VAGTPPKPGEVFGAAIHGTPAGIALARGTIGKYNWRIVDFLSGNLSRRTMLRVMVPLIGIFYFGSLAVAVALFPKGYDWRTMSISKLLYPLVNPQYHYIPAVGVGVTGVLLLPFAGYIRRGLGVDSRVVRAGAAFFFSGAVCLILASVITSHPAQGRATVPQLHAALARVAGIGLGLGMVLFESQALRSRRRAGGELSRRRLVCWWGWLTWPGIVVMVLALILRIHLPMFEPLTRALKHSPAWKLGFWEWIGSAAAYGFLVVSAWFLPGGAERMKDEGVPQLLQ
jgi:hypothetical protein